MESTNENAYRFTNGSINFFKWMGFEFQSRQRWKEVLLGVVLCEMFIIAAGQAIDITLSEKDLQKTTEAMTYLNYYLVSLGKLVSLVYNRRDLHAIVVELRRLYPSVRVEENYKLENYLKWYLRMERILSLFFYCTACLYNVTQIISMIVDVCRGKPFVYTLPLNVWNPVSIPHTWQVLIFTYIAQAHGSFMSALTILATDLCLFSSLMQLCMHFDIICRNIVQIEPDDTQEAEIKLKEQIVYHQSVLKLTNTINSIFTPSILFSLLSSSMILCFTGYQLLSDVNSAMITKLVVLLLYEFKQVVITCFLGDRLMDTSLNVADAIYEHKWYNGTKNYKQMVLITLIMAQQTVALNIAGISDVSRETLRQVLSFSYKIFALLKS